MLACDAVLCAVSLSQRARVCFRTNAVNTTARGCGDHRYIQDNPVLVTIEAGTFNGLHIRKDL